MIKKIITAFCATFTITGCHSLPSDMPVVSEASLLRVTTDEFRVLEGAPWAGELEYLNYGRDDRSSIPVGLKVDVLSDTEVQYALKYPGEAQHNAKEIFRLTAGGTELGGARLVSRQEEKGVLEIVTRGSGQDDGKLAEIEMVYVLSARSFTMRKNVKFEGSENYFNRNEYRFTR